MPVSYTHLCCVVLASEGYPKKYESGFPITMSKEAAAHTYVAGAKKDGNALPVSYTHLDVYKRQASSSTTSSLSTATRPTAA